MSRKAVVSMLACIVLLVVVFFVVSGGRVSADSGNLNSIVGYEKILVRPGDTLDSLSYTYAGEYSHLSVSEYKSQIIRLNNLRSEYIRAGVYLLMPISDSSSV